jgi:integrase
MSWDAAQARWTKMYKGKRYTVACAVLGAPPTKDGSYQAANLWWQKKRVDLDGPPRPGPDPRVEILEQWAGREIASQEDLRSVLVGFLTAGALAHEQGQPVLSREQHAAILGEARVSELEKAVEAFRNPPAVADGSVHAWAQAWQKHQQGQVEAGLLSALRAGNNQTCLAHFVAYAGRSAPVETLTAARLQGFYAFCLGKVASRRGGSEGWSVGYARDVFSVSKAFVRWLWEQEAITLPKNIGSKAFKFGNGYKQIKTWTAEEFKWVVSEAPGKLQLALLLMANCGMTQQDVSDLEDEEVDWTEGRIIRKRSKTGDNENVPTVNYKLWPATFALLKKYRSGTARVLLTESGLPFVRTGLKDGRVSKADGFASNFVHVKRRLGFAGSLKQLRSMGATMLEAHKDFGRFKSYFLGHSPKTVADKHYARPSQELFDTAVEWLGKQLGQG